MIRIGSLFAGIGGIELGLELAFAEAGLHAATIYQVEIDPFCRAVLARHWPDSLRFNDVQTERLPPADVLCGGFPCQDLSTAGRGAGLTGSKSQLWWDYARHIGRIRPAVAVVENVSHGRGRWLPYVRRDLAALGYRTRAIQVSARDVGAPHLRERVFVVAYANGQRLRFNEQRMPRRWADEVCDRRQALASLRGEARRLARTSGWPARPTIHRVDDGLPHRVDRHRALGNAALPAVAQVIGRIIIDDIRKAAT